MTAVRFRESAGYGARCFAYLLGVTLLGGAFLALGGLLAAPELTELAVGGQAGISSAVAGGVLAFLGVAILSIGYLGTAYKLVADAVAAGTTGGADVTAPPSAETAPSADATGAVESGSAAGASEGSAAAAGDESTADDEPRRAPGIEPESDAPAAETAEAAETEAEDEWGPPGEAGEEGVTADYDEYGSRQTEGPPEPTPEEIAFGSSGDDRAGDDRAGADRPGDDGSTGEPAAESEPVDEPVEERGTSSVKPAGRNATSDPLADPTEDE